MSETPKSVRLRASSGQWLLVAILGLISIGLIYLAVSDPHLRTDVVGRVCAILMVLIFGGMTVMLALVIASGFVQADGNGLEWRNWRGRKFTPWEDVEDFYDRSTVSNNRRVLISTIRTRQGVIRIQHDWEGDREAFRDLVTQNAVRARAKAWDLFGARREDEWPRTFGYRGADNRTVTILLGIALLLGIVWIVMLIPKAISDAQMLGWQWGVARLFVGFFGLAAMPLYLVAVAGWRLKDRSRRGKERITVDLETFRFSSPEKEITLRWEEIADFYIVTGQGKRIATVPHYAVKTTAGEEIVFTQALQDAALLQVILEKFATGVKDPSWRAVGPDTEAITGAGSGWSGGYPGIGDRIFHYRTRTNRAMLRLAWLFAFVTFVRPLEVWTGLFEGPIFRETGDYIFFSSFWVAAVYFTWRYFAARIQLNGSGITEFSAWGRRTIPWKEIDSYGLLGNDPPMLGFVRQKGGRRLCFWLTIADGKELQEEITKRAINATGSWEKPKKSAQKKREPETAQRQP